MLGQNPSFYEFNTYLQVINPSITIRIQLIFDTSKYVNAFCTYPDCISWSVSSPKLENVLKPPQNPVTINKLRL